MARESVMNPMREFVVGEWVVLKGISRHGKQRIDQHGKEWEVRDTGTFNGIRCISVLSEGETFKLAPGHKIRDMRWIHIKDDPDFEVILND